MDYYTLVFGSIFALSFLYTLAKLSSRVTKKLPPGPSPWPIIGNMHLLGAKPHVSLSNLAKTYGPVMSLKLGQLTTVVISSSPMAEQVLKYQDQAFSVSPEPSSTASSLVEKSDARWELVRRTSLAEPILMELTSFHGFEALVGVSDVFPAILAEETERGSEEEKKARWSIARGPCCVESVRTMARLDANQHLRSQKVKELIAYCAKCSQEGRVVDIGQAAFKISLNLMSNTLFSKDLADPFSDSKVELKEIICSIMVEVGKPNLVDFFPILVKIDPQGVKRRATIYFGKLFKLFDGLINERLEERRRGFSEKCDVLETLLNITEKDREEMNHNHIKSMFTDLIMGPTDTTTSTLQWAMTEILKQPETMKKAQAELAEIISKGKSIEETGVSRLPYLQCIIKETLRMHPPLPLLIPCRVEQDVELCDYIIPKDSQDPLVFKPERFWSSDKDVWGQDFDLIPFSVGRRICPGLPLALKTVPVILGSLLNSFNWKLEADIEPKDLDMEETFGITLAKAHPLLIIPSPL
ncbi:Geraniol 8-hydroxylase [Capsicum chinense]|nr:Geraniol 8-hydroxylase [Capsicum chinense]